MKVLFLSRADIGGGAFAAAYRLFTALRRAGLDVEMWCNKKQTGDPDVSVMPGFGRRPWRWFMNRLVKYGFQALDGATHKSRSLNLLPSRTSRRINITDFDLVHLHCVNSEMMSLRDIGRIRKPAVWTIHDMWPFLGTEHYTVSEGVGGKGAWRKRLIRRIDEHFVGLKQRSYRPLKLAVVAPSKWLAQCARESVPFRGCRIEAIPNCIDEKVFCPRDPIQARRRFGLPQDKPLLLFGMLSDEGVRKGADLFRAAMSRLKDTLSCKIGLVLVGSGSPLEFDGFETMNVGQIAGETKLAELYSACNALALPSRMDNLPNMGVEAIACGLPVVAFNVGGLPDIVDHQVTGYLAQPFDIAEYAEGIRWMLFEDRERMAECARQKALSVFSEERVVRQYSTLYAEWARTGGACFADAR